MTITQLEKIYADRAKYEGKTEAEMIAAIPDWLKASCTKTGSATPTEKKLVKLVASGKSPREAGMKIANDILAANIKKVKDACKRFGVK